MYSNIVMRLNHSNRSIVYHRKNHTAFNHTIHTIKQTHIHYYNTCNMSF